MDWLKILGIITGFTLAEPAANAGGFDITRLVCTIRDGKFLTQFEFKYQTVADVREMTGELSNFLLQDQGEPKYISGTLFVHINYNDSTITGDTGDTADLLGRFALTRMDYNNQGRWSYAYQQPGHQIVRGIFACTYQDEAKRYPHPTIPHGNRRRSRP